MPISRIDVKQVGETTIALCRDMKLNDDLVIQEWGEQLLDILEKKKSPRLLVNFERVIFMSSSALRELIKLNKKAKDCGTALVLCSIDDNIMEAFRITRLDTVFQIKKTEDEGVKALSLLAAIPPQAR